MNPRVVTVEPRPEYQLLIGFSNGERRLFDVRPYLELDVFQSLKDVSFFRSVRIGNGTAEWPGEIDISPDTLYIEGVPESATGQV